LSSGEDQAEDPVLASARLTLETIAGAIAPGAAVRVMEGPDGVSCEFLGEDLTTLIGRRGETLDAIQHLVYRIATRGCEHRVRVTVDAGGHRERRAEALRAVADQAAELAVREGREVALEPMSPLERRFVHEHLKGRPGVETHSEGQEPSRRLVVSPLAAG
jgi:spoIIIJ-associated protein